MKATAFLVVGSLILAPAVRAEEAAGGTAQQEYDRRYLSFEELGAVDLHTGTVYRLTEPYQGKYKNPIAPEAFYRLVGREDLAQEYQDRQLKRALLVGGGIASIFAGSIAAMLVSWGSSTSCDPFSAGFAQCSSAAQDDAQSRLLTSIGVIALSTLVGGTLAVVGLATDPDPVGLFARRELADHYNQDLRRQLGMAAF
jgi:hypothetical protein